MSHNAAIGTLEFQMPPSAPLNKPFLVFRDGAGAEMARIRFDSPSPYGTAIYIGENAGGSSGDGTGGNNVGIGRHALSNNVGGAGNIAIGSNALLSQTTSDGNVAIGQNTLLGLTTGWKNVAIGDDTMDNDTAAIGSYNVAVGTNVMDNGYDVGDSNIAIGPFINNGGGALLSGNTLIGSSLNCTGIANTIVIASSLDVNVSNVVVIGKDSQNIILGTPYPFAGDNGARLQILGDFTTADPGAGVGKWKVGKLVTAAVTPDTTRYVQVAIDGVIYKLIVSI